MQRKIAAYARQTYQSTQTSMISRSQRVQNALKYRRQMHGNKYNISKMIPKKFLKATLVGTSLITVSSYVLRNYGNEAEAQEKPNEHSRIDEDRYSAKAVVQEIVDKMEGKSLDNLEVTMYQYQVCPFCCKVRAFLDYHKIKYKIVEVNPMTKAELKAFNSKYKKVPVVICNGVQLNDSSVIITTLAQVLANLKGAEYPFDKDEEKWRRYVDEVFVRRIPPNIYRSYSEAMQAFEYISEENEFNWYQKSAALYGGSLAMWGVSKKLKQKYEITDERQAIYNCAKDWTNGLGNKPFMGGSSPNLADLAVYGIISSIEGLSTFNDMCHETEIGEFYYRMKSAIGESSGSKE